MCLLKCALLNCEQHFSYVEPDYPTSGLSIKGLAEVYCLLTLWYHNPYKRWNAHEEFAKRSSEGAPHVTNLGHLGRYGANCTGPEAQVYFLAPQGHSDVPWGPERAPNRSDFENNLSGMLNVFRHFSRHLNLPRMAPPLRCSVKPCLHSPLPSAESMQRLPNSLSKDTNPEDGTCKFSRHVGNPLNLYAEYFENWSHAELLKSKMIKG
jgi:hypothetical protein